MNRQLAFTILALALTLAHCNQEATSPSSVENDTSSLISNNESKGDAKITSINTNGSQTNLNDFESSTFSKHVLRHKKKSKLLISYDFFPEGTRFCHQKDPNAKSLSEGCVEAAQILIPCEFSTNVSDDISFNLNAPIENVSCDDPFVLQLNEGELTLDGLLVDVSESWDGFADFGFITTNAGFLDLEDGQALTSPCKDNEKNVCHPSDLTDSNCHCDESKLEDLYKKILEK